MKEREYIHRGGPGVRRRGPPWIFWVLLGLALIVAVTFLIVKLTESADTLTPPESTDVSSSLEFSSPPLDKANEGTEVPSSSLEPTPSPQASIPERSAPQSAPTDLGGFIAADGTGYACYKFNEEATNSYITAVSAAGTTLGAQVYSIVVPTALDVLLPESYLLENQIDSSDQKKAIDRYIYPSIHAMSPSVKTVPTFDPLASHCNENIYFRTQGAWTQLGAYYVYVQFCAAKGIEAVPLEQFTKKEYEGFQGSYYGASGDYEMGSDRIEAYISPAQTELSFTDSQGIEYDGWAVISDGDGYSSELLHLIFNGGDQPYKVLENKDLSDGSACVVVQDSLGCYFIPFLTSHYQYVYALDYRTYSGNAAAVAAEHNASDIILLNSVVATSSAEGVEAFRSILGMSSESE